MSSTNVVINQLISNSQEFQKLFEEQDKLQKQWKELDAVRKCTKEAYSWQVQGYPIKQENGLVKIISGDGSGQIQEPTVEKTYAVYENPSIKTMKQLKARIELIEQKLKSVQEKITTLYQQITSQIK